MFDSLLTCLVADNMTGERHNSDREIFGQGLANMACGLVGGVTTATATMRTVAKIKCGGRTGLACVTHGVVPLALMLGLAAFASTIPTACLAGILLKVDLDIIEKAHANGAKVVNTGLKPATDRVFRRLKILDKVGYDRCFDSFDEAMQWIYANEAL